MAHQLHAKEMVYAECQLVTYFVCICDDATHSSTCKSGLPSDCGIFNVEHLPPTLTFFCLMQAIKQLARYCCCFSPHCCTKDTNPPSLTESFYKMRFDVGIVAIATSVAAFAPAHTASRSHLFRCEFSHAMLRLRQRIRFR